MPGSLMQGEPASVTTATADDSALLASERARSGSSVSGSFTMGTPDKIDPIPSACSSDLAPGKSRSCAMTSAEESTYERR